MKLALIGSGMHWHVYAPALNNVPQLTLAAVAAAGPEETLGAFDHAPGLTVTTRRFDDPRRMLDEVKPEIVQICCRPDRIAHWTRACVERGIATMAEKPLAMNLAELEKLYATAKRYGAPLAPMHTMRGDALLAAVAGAVREDRLGRPQLAFSQKSYRWGRSRPDWFRQRATYPGLMPWVGIHALDWLHWMLGDIFSEVQGVEGAAPAGFPASALSGAYSLRMTNGGTAALTLDFLRPDRAPTHGDERVRIVGTKGVVEAALAEKKATLISEGGQRTLEPVTQLDVFTVFARSVRGEGPPLMSVAEAFRITEIALKAQTAAETGKKMSLAESAFR